MTHVFKIFRFFIAATMLAMVATPSGAAGEKKFYAEFPSTIASGAAVNIAVKLVNVSAPPGISTINAAVIVAPPNVTINSVVGLTINGVAAGSAVLSQAFSAPTPFGTGQVGQKYYVLSSFTGIKRGDVGIFTISVNTSSYVSCTPVSWGAEANTGQNTYPQGDQFAPQTGSMKLQSGIGCDGTIACGNDVVPPPPPGVTAKRWFNKDGSVCTAAFFDLTADLNNRKVSLVADPSQPQALFEVTVTWNPEFVDPITGMPKPTKVGWSADTSIVFPGRACIDDIPVSLGTLTADLGGSAADTSVQVSGVSISKFPTPIVIDSERMSVTGQTGSTLTVVRGDGGTAADIVPHSRFYADGTTAKSVMSTPFPLDSNNKVMKACILSESFDTVPAGSANNCSPITPAKACIQVQTTVLGDLAISRD